MEPVNILFSAASTMTGGLVTDMTTAMVAMVVVGLLCMGVDYLREVFERQIHQRNTDRSLRDAQEYRKVIDNSSVDPAIRDMYKAKYRNAISRAAR